MTDALRFVEETHKYFIGDVEIPGVTACLDEFLCDFSMVDPEVLERARDLGDKVHKATELADRSLLDWEDLDESLKPYVVGWQKFKREMGFLPMRIEHRVYHPAWRYAGTLDRIGYLHGDETGPLVLVDIKRRDQLTPEVCPQTAAYLEAYNAQKSKTERRVTRRACVRLFEDGYKFDWLDNISDFSVFQSCLQLYAFKLRHRLPMKERK